jgi:hypothetical protein
LKEEVPKGEVAAGEPILPEEVVEGLQMVAEEEVKWMLRVREVRANPVEPPEQQRSIGSIAYN